MSTDDTAEEQHDGVDGSERVGDDLGGGPPAVEDLDPGLVDLLAWVLDTETRARIYLYLRAHPDSTSREVADGTGLYPSTVREALAELNAEGTVSRQKRESGGAGNNPYEYDAIAPSDLVVEVVDRVQRQLNTVYHLDDRLAGRERDVEPIEITVGDEERGDAAADTERARVEEATDPARAEEGTDRARVEDGAESVGADDD